MATTLMIVGDSISEGSAGDYTWRFRLWEHLKASGVADVAFVGPRRGLDDLSRPQPNADSGDYADSGFDENHLALWGEPLVAVIGQVGHRVHEFDPDIVLTLLGINDLIWQDRTALQMEQDTRTYVAEVRRHKSGAGLVFGRLLPNFRTAEDPSFSGAVAEFNDRLESLAAELSQASSPVAVAATDDGYEPALHTWDGIHPNSNGEIRIAAAFADVLAQVFDLGSLYPRPLPDVVDVVKTP